MSFVVSIINGPNLNMLGQREPALYGSASLEDIAESCRLLAEELAQGSQLKFFQNSCEGALIDAIHSQINKADGLVINGGGYAHTSVALADALRLFGGPKVEVHLTNVSQREPYRHFSYLSSVCNGVIAGFGGQSYLLALRALFVLLQKKH